MPGKPSRARFVPKLAPQGRLHGIDSPPGLLVNIRRTLHLSLALLLAGAVLLFLLFGPPKPGSGGADTPGLLVTDGPSAPLRAGLPLDGVHSTDGLPLDGDHATGGAGESISAAALSVSAAPQPIPIVLHEDGLTTSTVATAATVNEALAQKGIVVEPVDYLFPSGGSPITAGTHIYIYHARQVSLSVDGDDTTLYSRLGTVGEVLKEANVSLSPQDRVEPPLDAPIEDGLAISVVRVLEQPEASEEVIPRSVIYQDDPTMDVGQYAMLDAGADGLIRREYRVVYENGQEIERELLSEGEEPPRDQLVAQGTKPVNIVQTPAGAVRYDYSLGV
ncbi:MAG: ubiquitin-like domain-containing protein, partial [Chloroflexota bacterium]|nr:ubiquitin-like domain-containing protein [Chloroflexota bacterium]